jgi:hypothetical protein
MGKIGLKSGKNAISPPISAQNSNCEPLFPPAPGVKQVLAYWLLHSTHYTQSHTEQKQTINTFFLQSSSFFIDFHTTPHMKKSKSLSY